MAPRGGRTMGPELTLRPSRLKGAVYAGVWGAFMLAGIWIVRGGEARVGPSPRS